jgi:hypothetical protein
VLRRPAIALILLAPLWAGRARAHDEIVVTAEPDRATASAVEIPRRELALRPRVRVSDVISAVPGLFAVQHAGGGKAYQYFLRGFDADHGTDVAILVDGVPVNLPTHAHGQGWADVNFVIPELVAAVSATKGPFRAAHGDFATAGAVDLRLSDHLHRSSVTLQGGSFYSLRGVAIVAPDLGDDWSTLFAAEASTTNGPFRNPERFRKLNLFGRVTRFFPRGAVDLTWMTYAGRWNASGQIPTRFPDRFDAVDPTDGGSTERHQASASYRYRFDREEVQALAYVGRQRFSLFSNFTFFLNDTVNGDQIQQADFRTFAGAHIFYRYKTTTLGVQARHDDIQNVLADTTARTVRLTRLDEHFAVTTLSVYGEHDARLLPFLRAVVGLRVDRNIQTLISPKASVISSPASFIDLFLSYGRGFHSNHARAGTRLVPADAYESGVRVHGSRGSITAAVFRIDMSSEAVWVADEGTTEPRGASRRIGAELGGRLRIGEGLFLDADATLTRARFLTGEAVPLAPTRTLTAGIAFKRDQVFGSLRVRSIAARPADEVLTADGWTIVDALIGYRIRDVELALDVQNLLNSGWREVQFANASRLRGEAGAMRSLHYTPGWPLTALVRATVFL